MADIPKCNKCNVDMVEETRKTLPKRGTNEIVTSIFYQCPKCGKPKIVKHEG